MKNVQPILTKEQLKTKIEQWFENNSYANIMTPQCAVLECMSALNQPIIIDSEPYIAVQHGHIETDPVIRSQVEKEIAKSYVEKVNKSSVIINSHGETRPVENHDAVNYPKHYTDHPSGIECIQVTEHMGFNLGNAVKYIWRCDLKKDSIEDLRKAQWYIEREIQKREKSNV